MNPARPFLIGALSLSALLTACLFEVRDEGHDEARRPEYGVSGYASLELRLKPAVNALMKPSTNPDTSFRLDTLVIELSAEGSPGAVAKYALGGLAETGDLAIAAKVFPLRALRTWKARIFTVDVTSGPGAADTVHRDSVAFEVRPGDTTYVVKTVNPAFAILRARLVSNSPSDIANPVKYVRIRVDGTTRDSMPVGRALRAVDLPNNNTGTAAGDSGFLLRTTNGGRNWTELDAGTAADLYSVSMPSASRGFAVGAGGTVIKTIDGTDWSPVASGTSADLYATFWTSGTNGWIAGAGGLVRKSADGSTFSGQESGTAADLHGAYFTSGSNGILVGDSGVILKTANGGSKWTAVSSGTSRNLSAVFFATGSVGFAVGAAGTILKTRDGGSTWEAQNSGTTADLTAVYMTTSAKGTVAGRAGAILTTSDGGDTWTAAASGTTQDLYGVNWVKNDRSGVAVGGYSAICYTRNNDDFRFQPFGARSFDVLLAYKHFTPGADHSLLLDAIDTLEGPLRGYQAARTVSLSPGKDTTLAPNASLSPCGFSGLPGCAP